MMREVTKEEFYGSVGRMDVVLRCEREATFYETRSRQTMGKSTPGYIAKFGEPRRYFVYN